MENQLIKTQQLPINELINVAKAFAESGMFADTKSMAQALVKIQAGQEIGIPPFASMTGIHIIQGKPTIGAGLIASRVKGSGKYDYKVLEASENKCSIDFYQGKEKIGNSTFTIEDAKKALTKNIEKFPKNMLFARAISNGVKWYCPDVFSGPVYTPEEFDMETKTEEVATITIITPEQIEEAKAQLIVASNVEELNTIYKAFLTEIKADESVIELAKKIKLSFTKNEQPS
jgi:hypothetical protein